MTLREAVDKYLKVGGGYGKSVPLESMGLSTEQTEKTFNALEEDYHIGRYIHFRDAAGQSYQINGFPQTHVSIDSEIQTVL
jgi:hypothetical protein